MQQALEHFQQFHRVDPSLISPPTRSYEIGEEVGYGGFSHATVEKQIDDKVYLLRVKSGKGEIGYRVTWWCDIRKIDVVRDEVNMFQPDLKGNLITSDIQSLIFHYEANGFVCDPSIQRGYVWSDVDKENLIRSIFERINIGSLVFVRMAGYLHQREAVRYNSLHGVPITLDKRDSYVLSVIDGQQRLRTIIEFYLDILKFNGKFYSQYSWTDQWEFKRTSLNWRTIEEEQITRKEILKMFLQVNRGVPQSQEHLDKIEAMYNAEGQAENKAEAKE